MFTQKELETKSGPELVAIFNALDGVNPVKRFRNREAGVKRILGYTTATAGTVVDPKDVTAAMVRAEREPGTTTQESTPLEKIRDHVALVTGSSKRGRKKEPRGVYNLTGGPVRRTCRPNSGRGRLVEFLESGEYTFTGLLALCPQWDEEQLHKTIKMTSRWLGFNLSTDDNGVILASR